MPFQIIRWALPPVTTDPSFHVFISGIQLEQRPGDRATVVVASILPNIKVRDVLVSLNGISLHNVEGGISGIAEIFKECQNSEMKIVIHRVDEVPNSWTPYQCNVIDQNNNQCKNIIHRRSNRFRVCNRHDPHYNPNQCKNEVDNKRCIRNRCINSRFCAICTPGNKCQVDGCDNDLVSGGCCDEHSGRCPQNFIVEYMEQKLDYLKANMSEKDYKILEAIHNLRKRIKDNSFQDDSFSIDDEILKSVDKLMEEFHSNNKYKDQQVRDTNNNWHPLLKHVHTRLVWILKAAIRDWRDDFHCDLPIQLMKFIADQVFEFFKRLIMSYHDEISTLVFKIGSGDADTRPFCAETYPPTVFQRDLRTDLGLKLPPHQRWKCERFAIKVGLGFIKCSNINLPGSTIPYTDVCERASLYMVASRSASLVQHVGDYAIDRRGVQLPPDHIMLHTSQLSSSNSSQPHGDASSIAGATIGAASTVIRTANGEAATSSSPHHKGQLVNRETTLVGLDDKMLRNVASFLPEPSQIMISMAVGRELQVVLTRQHNEEGCIVDFGTDNDLATIIRDGDLKQLLRHAENSVGVKALMLTDCIHITGEGLAPLDSSENIEQIDLRVIAESEDNHDEPVLEVDGGIDLSCGAIVPILRSIVDTPNSFLYLFINFNDIEISICNIIILPNHKISLI